MSTAEQNFALLPEAVTAIELDWYAENDTVTVIPRNKQRFDIQKDHAIEILRRANDQERFNQQFDFLNTLIVGWIRRRTAKIAQAMLTLQDATLVFLVVQSSEEYDERFQDDLIDLDYDIANDPALDLVKLKTILLPKVGPEAISSFLDSRFVVTYHAQ